MERIRRRRAGARSSTHGGRAQRAAPLPDGLGHGLAGTRALLPRPAAAQGRHDPDPHRRRAGADALHRPRRRARQHLALAARAGGLRARRTRRRRLRHAGLLADLRPAADVGKLRSLGRRLDPPPGWRYRMRRLRADLDLGANGSATIVQDELQNTYQLARATRPAGRRKRHAVSIDGRDEDGPAGHARHDRGRGTVTGTPFGARLGQDRRRARGRARHRQLPAALREAARSTARPTMPFTIEGNEIDFRGTARFTARHRRLPRHHERRAPGPRQQHARRAERRDVARGLRDATSSGRSERQRRQACRSSAQARASRSCSRARSRSAAAVRPRPVRLSTRLSASSGSLSRS